MARPLLSFPPELVVQILEFLPVKSLLKFSQTCRYSHALATSTLHTLSLGIYPTRIASIISRLGATMYPTPKNVSSAFSKPDDSASMLSAASKYSCSSIDFTYPGYAADEDQYKVSVIIPDSKAYEYTTQLAFHTALTRSILNRHCSTLMNLDLSLWTLTPAVAKTLARMPALRTLSIRIEDYTHTRSVPAHRILTQRTDEHAAWEILSKEASWASRINALRIEGGEMTTQQLATLLRPNRWCRELWVCKCSRIGRDVWEFLGCEWEGRTALRILGVMRCGGQLDENVLELVGGLSGLQFVTLLGCHGLDSETVEKYNRENWNIRECIPPQPRIDHEDMSTEIEVDPAYITPADDALTAASIRGL